MAKEKILEKLLLEFLKTLNFLNMNICSVVDGLTTKILNITFIKREFLL